MNRSFDRKLKSRAAIFFLSFKIPLNHTIL
uniref:Uncharacterized protein n=1 Tax=Anopheles funestus TaxID=62324 RepID=A0A182S4A3_ANOFN